MPRTREKLSPKQKSFCGEYIIDKNGTQAAIRAGYSKKTAKEQATRLLTKVYVQRYLSSLISKQSKRTEITADFVLNSLRNIAQKCQQNEPVRDSRGRETGQYKFDSAGANRAVELLGKHLALFVDRKEITQKMIIKELADMTDEEIDAFLKRTGNANG